MRCEQHPWQTWPHGDCAGPGMNDAVRYGDDALKLLVAMATGGNQQAVRFCTVRGIRFDVLDGFTARTGQF